MCGERVFENNLRALSGRNPELCARIKAARALAGGKGPQRYRFLSAPSGETVPALIDDSGGARPLHSTVNPRREAERLTADAARAGFVVFLGLGGGFAPAAALGLPGVCAALAIDYDLAGVAELLRARDYSALLGDPRFTLLVDPAPALVESAILETYQPALFGGMSVLPLRARVERDMEKFGEAGEAARRAVEKVSADYSVQAHFGERWLANIVRNVMAMRFRGGALLPRLRDSARETVVCAAGPSLDAQAQILVDRKKKGRGGMFVICADTALPALASHGLKPDAIVSIDCQHVSCQHFAGIDCRDVPLFLDVASPPALSGFSGFPFFFAGAHPLARYLRMKWAHLPALDTSGGNVAFACLSLAESLGARRVTVCGADFCYPADVTYARGTYVYPFFERRQSRLSTLEAQASRFLFRAPFLPAEPQARADGVPRRETASMRAYRASFARKMSEMSADVEVMPGLGIAPVALGKSRLCLPAAPFAVPARPATSAREFLEGYAREVSKLPPLTGGAGFYELSLGAGERLVFTTMLPLLAALKRRRPELGQSELAEAAKRHCADAIRRALG